MGSGVGGVLSAVILILLLNCVTFTTVALYGGPGSRVYGNVHLRVHSDVRTKCVSGTSILTLLGRRTLSPANGLVSRIDYETVRIILGRIPLVTDDRYCGAVSNCIIMRIRYHHPVLQIVTSSNSGFCISRRKRIVRRVTQPTCVPITAKRVDHRFTQGRLLALTRCLYTSRL